MSQDDQIRRLFARHAGVVLTVPELADLMSISQRTVLNYINEGKLPAFKLPRGHRIITDDAIAFFESIYTGAGAPAGDAPAEPPPGDPADHGDDLPAVRQLRPATPSTDQP